MRDKKWGLRKILIYQLRTKEISDVLLDITIKHLESQNNGCNSNGSLKDEILKNGEVILNHPSVHKIEFNETYFCVHDFDGRFDGISGDEHYRKVLNNIITFSGKHAESIIRHTEFIISHGVIEKRYGWYITKPPTKISRINSVQ